MPYKITHYGYKNMGFSKTRKTTVATYKTKAEAQSHAKKMNKYTPGINARVVMV